MSDQERRAKLQQARDILARRKDQFIYPPGVDKDMYDAQTILEGGGAEADAAVARIDAKKDLTELFFVQHHDKFIGLHCGYRGKCEWFIPLPTSPVNVIFQQMTQHAFTNHGRPMV